MLLSYWKDRAIKKEAYLELQESLTGDGTATIVLRDASISQLSAAMQDAIDNAADIAAAIVILEASLALEA